MRWLRIFIRVIAATILFAIVFPLGYVALVAEHRGLAPTIGEPEAKDYRVYVVDWGYHTAIVVEQPRGWALGPPGQEGAAFLEYAWGDRSFYLDDDYRPHVLFATLVLPTPTVIYLGAHSTQPSFPGARAVYIRTVDAVTQRALFVALEKSLQRKNGTERMQPYERTRREFSGRFYAAHGAYLWPRDCNWWTVARLAEVGLASNARGVLFSGQVGGRLLGFTKG